MLAQDLLNSLGQSIQLQGLKFDENNRCYLVFDKTLTVTLEHKVTSDTLMLYGIVCKVSDDDHAIIKNFLEANLFGKGSGQASFSLDTTTNQIFLCQFFDLADIVYTKFEKSLESFVNRLGFWQKEVEEGRGRSEVPSSAVASVPTSFNDNMLRV